MVDLNSDLILEVPDTPDQIGQAICQSSGPSSRRDIGKMDASPFRPRRILFKNRNNSITGQSSQGNLSSVSPAPLDAEHLFRQAALARLLSEDLDAKSSTPKSDTTIGPIENGKRAEKLDLKQSNSLSILNHANCKDTGGSSRSCQIREVDSSLQDASHKNADFLGVGSSLPTILTGRPRSKNGTITSNRLKEVVCDDVCAGSKSSEDKGEVIYNKATGALSSAAQSVIPQRHVSQRKLVRNGCISPSNIAKRIVKTDKKQEVCSTSGVSDHSNPQVDVLEKGNVIDLTDSSPIITKQGKPVSDGLTSVDNMETRTAKKMKIVRVGERVIPQAADHVNGGFYSEGRSSGLSDKGKEIIHDGTGAKQTVEANLRRVCPSVVGDCSIVANSDSSVINSDEQGWRTTHNHTDKSPMFILGKTASIHGGESGSAWPSNQNQETAAGDNNNSISRETTILPARLEIRTPRVGRGKRKYGSSTYHAGGSSSSVGEPETSCHAYSNTMSDRRHTTCRHEIPIVEIDDICSPEVRPIGSRGHINVTSSGPNTTAQLESDELLARQLQEQLYNESPSVVPTEEIDAIIAMSLQHEEDAHQTSRTLRRYRNYTRGARTTRTSASQHATRAAYGTASSSISHMGNIAPIINMHLGAAVARFPSALQIHPNIDLNDYDALLALDENNHQHTGASESQINNLPQSVVQSNSTQEPCAVCLENPSVGDTIRHLPCFHKFHKECIDEWLRRKKLCPVCKSGIT